MSTKTATTVEEQIEKLRSRGMTIEDDEKAKEILLDIGYYRLGFYWFRFEKTYPELKGRKHEFKDGASFKESVDLYYLDTEIRNLLAPFLYRIEVNFRTYLIYYISNHYKQNPTWFAASTVVGTKYIESTLKDSYKQIRNNDAIKHHHRKYPNDIYAPAWKTLEYMTFCDILILAQSLKDHNLQNNLAAHYGLKNTKILWNWMHTIRVLRNLCAHGHNIYDLRIQKSITSGPLGARVKKGMQNDLRGALLIVFYLLEQISPNRAVEIREKLREVLRKSESKAVNNALGHINDVL